MGLSESGKRLVNHSLSQSIYLFNYICSSSTAIGDNMLGHDLELWTPSVKMVYGPDTIPVDTPEFDDSCKTDTEIWETIVDWLKET